MSGLTGAWLVGEALVIWRQVHQSHRLPVPGALLGITGLFAALGLAAEYAPARGLVTAVAWGLDVAALFNALPAGLGGQVNQVQQQEQAAAAPPQSRGEGQPA